MTTLLSRTFAVALVVTLVDCGGTTPPPAPDPAPGTTPTPGAPMPSGPADADTPPPPPIAGGYRDGDVDSPEAREQASHAIELLRAKAGDPSIQLVAIKAFAQQVVAGMNYRLQLDISTAAGPKHVAVRMYQDLHQHRELSDVTGL